MNIQLLNSKFAPKGNVFFKKGKNDLVIAKVDNKFACCEISLYGGQILSFEPQGEENLLWLSKKSAFEKGKAIRGGIPVCFPWFGPHASDPSMPQHGFARLMDWEADHVFNLADASTRIILKCVANDFTKKYWPYDFEATLTIIVGSSLEVAFNVKNTGNEAFEYTDALHTYFKISSPENIHIKGLQNTKYLDGTDNNNLKVQSEDVLRISKEENRRYMDHSGTSILKDEGFSRKIVVRKEGSNSTVVWNPWDEASKKMHDMTHDGYKEMICIEAANAYNDIIRLQPGENHVLKTIINLEKI